MWTWQQQPTPYAPQWLNCPKPKGVFDVTVDCNSVTDTFGCRIAVDLTGTFDEQAEGLAIARRYAEQLSVALGVPGVPVL